MAKNYLKGQHSTIQNIDLCIHLLLNRYLIRKFSLNGEQQLLDLGCGTGQLTLRFSDWCRKIVGIDLEREMLE
ncbi:methyltransferase domain-containing protein [Heyndrickxia oleronia]|uniref:methyltransferase domain-containing protein n=1 Tax=Heyndrickxia oleronia TaxID=38875 RepID=UPI001BB3A4C0|nr:class I SAM-dependent methyltransferase [Heyndrickxia oleronia]